MYFLIAAKGNAVYTLSRYIKIVCSDIQYELRMIYQIILQSSTDALNHHVFSFCNMRFLQINRHAKKRVFEDTKLTIIIYTKTDSKKPF